MNRELIQVAFRQRALYLPVDREAIDQSAAPNSSTLAFLMRLREVGYCVDEELLRALCPASSEELTAITEVVDEAFGVNLNWAPLVKGWDVPTGESVVDHLATLFVNCLNDKIAVKGTMLPCGHLIPDGTFPLERYNGCPFCGRPFVTADFVYTGQGSKRRELHLYTDDDLRSLLASFLASPVPLDATQCESLGVLLQAYPRPNVEIKMKETVMLVVRSLVAQGKAAEAMDFIKTPTDILRYLWYVKTGKTQIVEPRTLIDLAQRNSRHLSYFQDRSIEAAEKRREELRLKYDRGMSRTVAHWMNTLPMSAKQAAEIMNPKRGMWVRMIRALRLGEYARREGMERLKELLDVFYRQDYTVWQGKLDRAQHDDSFPAVARMLRQRPGLFARCLFATMLRFGADSVLAEFDAVADLLPARLLLSLVNAAESYFNVSSLRTARAITGRIMEIEHNKLLALYSAEEREAMVAKVSGLYKRSMTRRYAAMPPTGKTIYIDPMLWHIPLGVSDRSTTVQDASCALQGTRFDVEGDAVRLFLQWGKGLHAQHLDMDISATIAFDDNRVHRCYYGNLATTGAKHSGDIRYIPEMVGTAEYIELSLPELIEAGARYVAFVCNAYTCGALSPNLVVGWMNSAYPMRISEEHGVAYDPSCVQHMVRISESNLAKGLVFGVLDVAKRQIIWLEMPLSAQTVYGANSKQIEAFLHKLAQKTTVGELLALKAEAQGLALAATAAAADEAYTYEWALNPAAVAGILL